MFTLSAQPVTATYVARNFSSVIDRVRMTGQPLTVTKGKQHVAQITPVPRGLSAAEVVDVFAALPDMGADREAFAADMLAARTASRQPLENPWAS